MSIISVKQAAQLSVAISNVPGSLAKVAKALAEAGVNIEGFSDKMGVAHLVSTPQDTAKQVLGSLGIQFSEEKMLAVNSSDSPGILAKVAGALGDASINIENVYVTTPGGMKDTVMYVGVSDKDFAKATEVLQQLKA